MGGKNRHGNGRDQRKSSSSFFSIFSLFFKGSKGRRSVDAEDNWDDAVNIRRVRSSDEDKGRAWVAEPEIDRKTSAFIAKFYETRVPDSDRQTFSVEQQQKAAN